MAIDKSTWNKKIKVSQSTIDTIKKQGMAASLKSASSNKSGEYQEALRRMYGDKRVSAATGVSTTSKKTAGQPSGYRNPKQTGPAAPKKSAVSSSSKPTKPQKKGVSGSTFLKGYAGTAAAVGLLALGRGKGAGVIAKLSPAVGRALNTPVGRALSGTAEKAKANVSATSGRIAATHKKEVSQSQYDAMVSAARLKGTKVTPAAKKAPAKKAAPKKTATAPKASRWDANAPKPRAPKLPKAK